MASIRHLLTQDHRDCDDFLAVAETCAGRQDPEGALSAFLSFERAMLAHFQAEENTLFPAFELKTGMTGGPTQVMRMEHTQIRGLISSAVDALKSSDFDEYFSQVETLVILMQQHNMKEENVLYPMCDQHLSDTSSELIARMEDAIRH